MSREFEYWSPEPIFAGQTVFCMASGPSLTPEVAEKVRGRRTAAVNSSCKIVPWADVLYFTDSSWYEEHRSIVRDWPGLVLTMSRAAKVELPDKVKRIKTIGDPNFPPIEFARPGSGLVTQGRSSGHTLVGAMIAVAATTIVLLGYDMRVVEGREHCHTDYLVGGQTSYAHEKDDPRWNNKREYSTVFVPAFNGWKAAADKIGVRILNATPGSAVTEFPFVDLDDVLREG